MEQWLEREKKEYIWNRWKFEGMRMKIKGIYLLNLKNRTDSIRGDESQGPLICNVRIWSCSWTVHRFYYRIDRRLTLLTHLQSCWTNLHLNTRLYGCTVHTWIMRCIRENVSKIAEMCFTFSSPLTHIDGSLKILTEFGKTIEIYEKTYVFMVLQKIQSNNGRFKPLMNVWDATRMKETKRMYRIRLYLNDHHQYCILVFVPAFFWWFIFEMKKFKALLRLSFVSM